MNNAKKQKQQNGKNKRSLQENKRYQGNISCTDGHNKGQKQYGPNRSDGIPAVLFQILKDDAVKLQHSVCQQIWKTQHWPQDCKRSVFIPISKKGSAKECSNYRTTVLISHASKVIFKILQAGLNCM